MCQSRYKVTLRAVMVIGAVLFLAYVWPTQWQYFKEGNSNVRVNRFTGETQHLGKWGWYTPAPVLPDFGK